MSNRKRLVLGSPIEGSMGHVAIDIENRQNSPLLIRRMNSKVLEKKQPAEKKKEPSPEKQSIDALHIIGKRPATWAALNKAGSKFRFGVPAWSFKHAIVDAAKFSTFHMKDIRRILFVEEDAPEMVEIFGKPVHCTQPGKATTGTAILIHRPIFHAWRATLRITFYARVISAEQVVELVAMAGHGGGVGEKRPNGKKSSGTCGRWRVTKAVADVPDFDEEEASDAA